VRTPIPLAKRPLDYAWIAFFALNLGFITYIVDIEQLIIADTSNFHYPLWPPAKMVDLIHWWGRTYDPALLAREQWWKATIWIDALFFGPFYAFALYAYVKGKEWIRIPTIIWSSVMITNVTIILFEEAWGTHASPHLGMVLFANAAWFLVPIFAGGRMVLREHPFTEERGADAATETASARAERSHA
jgi:hypothetical protein